MSISLAVNLLARVRQQNPLILNITNLVTMDFIANGLLSIGASPLMSVSRDELDDLMPMVAALVVNLGTLDKAFLEFAQKACELANRLHKTIVLDPVGAGASALRTEASLELLNQFSITAVRANASEILALAACTATTKGVDSVVSTAFALDAARELSEKYDVAVIMSGEMDYIIDHQQTAELKVGSPVMAKITGSGCLLSAVSAAFLAIETNRFAAATAATHFYGMCGERAAQAAEKPGSFKVAFLDELSCLALEDLHET